MQEDKKLTNVASLTMILATLALGWFKFGDVALPALPFDRPKGSVVASEEDITARLWEDPLNAVLAGKEETDDQKHGTENLRTAIALQGNTCLMVVPIPGTPFPDDVETRLRIRYSVQMAMADKGYAPDNHDHLGYVKLPDYGRGGVHFNHWPTAFPDPKDKSADTADVPYEWFSSTTTATAKILVLWLPEEWLGKEPLCRLAALRSLLTPYDPAVIIQGPFVIGPRSSDTLKAIAGNQVLGHRCQTLLKDNLCFFSCQATAPDTLIEPKLIEPKQSKPAIQHWADARKGIKERLQNAFVNDSNWSYFDNFIPTDDQLTDLLVKELNLRRVIPAAGSKQSAPEDGTILILSEADTSYGRALPMAFKASVNSFTSGGFDFKGGRSTTPDFIKTLSNDATGKTQSGIRTARYLRGLDTQKGEQKKDKSDEKSGENSAGQLLADNIQKKAATAFGESQLDYAERLAEQLAADMEGTTGGKKVKAVGILGGDIYDKLILLRTLRPKFKEALFFTTDLDARLWQPENLKFTHNLVVASAYNINEAYLRQKDADRPPPFRDVYQVAVFHACQAAIDLAADNYKPQDCPIPRLYEIGKQGPVELKLEGLQVSPAPEDTQGWQYCLAGICLSFCIAMLIAFLVSFREPWNQWLSTRLAQRAFLPTWLRQSNLNRLKKNLSWLKANVARLLLATFMIGLCGLMLWLWFALHSRFNVEAAMARGGAYISMAVLFCLIILSLKDARRDNDGLKFRDLFNKQTGWAGWFLCGTLLIEVYLVWCFYDHAALPENEPWGWTAGVSIWPTELVRVLIITVILWMLTWAWHRFLRRFRTLAVNYKLKKTQFIGRQFPVWIFTPWSNKSILWRLTWMWKWFIRQLRPLSASARRTKIIAIIGKVFDIISTPLNKKSKRRKSKVNAKDLFQRYSLQAGLIPRCFRVLAGAGTYYGFIYGIFLIQGFPINTNVRGDWAHSHDLFVMQLSIFCWLFLVFFVLDSVNLAAQLLKGLGGEETEWPAELLREHEQKLGLDWPDLEGYLDVKFAADKTQELKVLVILPFLIQFLMLVARNDYFDDWSWTPALVAVFVCNILLSSVAWIILRRAAAKLKQEALDSLEGKLLQAEQASNSKRKAGLLELKQKIEEQELGAYARWFQDPAFMAMLLPTGLFGILSVLFRTLFVAS